MSSHAHADDCAAQCPLAAVGRREFIAQSVLAAAALALAACGGAGGDGATAPSTISSSIRVSDYPELASTGGVALVTVSGARLAIVRTGAASFVALSRVCPHEGGTVNQSSGGFTCPVHGARFSTTGTWLGGERTTNMRSYATSYDAASGTLSIG
jgi:cytochrome b6-f complex iron-sulfur subunit